MRPLFTLIALCACLIGMNQQPNKNPKYVNVASFNIDKNLSAVISSYPDLQIRKLSSVEITLNAKPGHSLKNVSIVGFDAQMPEHRHGMVVTPSKPKKLNQGDSKKITYRIDGVKLHMPGKWVLQVKLSGPDGEKMHEIPLEVKL